MLFVCFADGGREGRKKIMKKEDGLSRLTKELREFETSDFDEILHTCRGSK